ncbi:MAG: YebC/PmpR family DNA-binding transcriptional regulator [Oscillospiraceae bacterium]|nr:YebC/PmpR family DNA-binding transcriptional regulator [Oscillospiraceae bacterium]MDY3936819.1 YebC/PmpR family DNA-binding transcriptional regulator [Oscillospiraceae bacterium]
MSGHSKWSTIKRKKEKTDNARAKVFTKIGREIAVAVKQGGPDPAGNSKLKDVIAKAKAANVPNDNIDRIIKKAAGDANADNFEEIVYEGYGPNGIAVVVEALTDNRNRTAGDVRHYFDKYGGNMGTSGCVMFMFEHKGQILIEKEDVDEDALMEAALEAGAEDFISDDEDVYEIRTGVHDVGTVDDALSAAGYTSVSAEAAYIPTTYTRLDDPDSIKNMGKMIEMFEDNDDIQAIWHNWENEDDYEG